MKSTLWTIVALSGIIALGGCNQRRSASAQDLQDTPDTAKENSVQANDTGNSEDSAKNAPSADAPQLPAPLPQRAGAEVTNTKPSSSGAKSVRPGNNWIYDTAKGPGFFLVAATSKPNTQGGDMIRRIDLNKPITEFDFDDEQAGSQGAFIYIPDEMKQAVPGKYIDSDGLFSAQICAFIPGPDKTIIALASGTEGGVALVLNPYEKAQAFTPLQAIKFPYASNPCRAVYSEELKKLYAIDVVHTESTGGQDGVFVADIKNDNSGSTASFYKFNVKPLVNNYSISNFMGVELYNDTLWLLSGNGRFDAEWDSVIYRVPLNEMGEPVFESAKYTRTHNPIERVMGCGISSWNLGSIAVVESSGKPVLLTSGTENTIAWDIQGDEPRKIDLNEKKPGVQGLNLSDFGLGGLKFNYAPKGSALYLLPHCRTSVKNQDGQTENPIFVSALDPASLKRTGGVDIGYTHVTKTLKSMGAPYMPIFSMTTRDLAVGTQHIAVLGSSGSNISGLGPGGDIIIEPIDGSGSAFVSNADMKANLKNSHQSRYGFKLATGDPKFNNTEQRSHAVIWIP